MDEKFQRLLRDYTASPSDDLAHQITNMLLRQRGTPDEQKESTNKTVEQSSVAFEDLPPEQQEQIREIIEQLPQMLNGMRTTLNRDMRNVLRDMRETFAKGVLDAFGRGFNL